MTVQARLGNIDAGAPGRHYGKMQFEIYCTATSWSFPFSSCHDPLGRNNNCELTTKNENYDEQSMKWRNEFCLS